MTRKYNVLGLMLAMSAGAISSLATHPSPALAVKTLCSATDTGCNHTTDGCNDPEDPNKGGTISGCTITCNLGGSVNCGS